VNRFALQARYPGFTLDARAEWDAPSAALFGPSGAGKSSVLEALVGLRPEIGGTIELAGRRVDGLFPEERRVGWVPQEASLFPHMTVEGNIEFAVRAGAARQRAPRSRRGAPAAMAAPATPATPAVDAPPAAAPADTAAAAQRAIEALEIGPLLGRRASELSGGERQRAAIARALASGPDLLLLDEPLASVDRPLRARIVPFLQALPARTGVPMLFVSHDPYEVRALARHVIVLAEGRVLAQGDPRDVLAAAASLGALEALSAENRFEVQAGARAGGVLHLVTSRGCPLEMAIVVGFPAPARVAIRAEDILLAAGRPASVSAQNVLEGQVTAIEPLGDHAHVAVDAAGERWTARVTQRAVDALDLQAGKPVHLVVKAHAVHACG
jgi:molybdate transport system ATP-binding protein